jgi:hypothetical protein
MTKKRARREKGTGSISEDRNGKFVAKLPGPGQPRLGTYDTYDEADAALLEYIGDPTPPRRRRNGQDADANESRRVTNLIKRYLEEVQDGTDNAFVRLGRVPGLPKMTDDPALVEKAIQYHAEQASVTDNVLTELKTRQRVRDLKRGLVILREHGGGSEAYETFVADGASWAAENGIDYATFREMGVSAKALREAGITRSLQEALDE